MSDVVIRVADLGKQYRIGRELRYRTLRETLNDWAAAPFRWLRRGGPAPAPETIWALRHVNLEVKRGEVIGIIGRNGAGKSTLLKVLARITEPTEGRVELVGRVGSLLEVGTGFHPELTGRDNIFLNGALLGMTRREIQRKFDEIVAFAEIDRFLDTPVKHYSSGMYMRLAFAVAAHLEPEILIVDEVLAVGDTAFQKKCLGKMGAVAREGRTVLFVSHNMHAVSRLCRTAVCLEAGNVALTGTPQETIASYQGLLESSHGDTSIRRLGSGELRFTQVRSQEPYYRPEEEKVFVFSVLNKDMVSGHYTLSAHVLDTEGEVLVQCDSRLVGQEFGPQRESQGVFRLRTPWLKPGDYRVDFFICCPNGIVDWFERACVLRVLPVLPYAHCATDSAMAEGCVFADFSWEVGAGSSEAVS